MMIIAFHSNQKKKWHITEKTENDATKDVNIKD